MRYLKLAVGALGIVGVGAVAAAVVYWGGGPSPAAAGSTAAAHAGTARAVFDNAMHDFGVMDVGDRGSHTFYLSNEGTAPLEIRQAGTSCKCTILEAPDGRIPPGEKRPIRLEWEAKEPTDLFRHGALIWTSDPENEWLRVVVTGRVARHCAVWPEVLVFGDMLPTEERVALVTVYSEVWPEFQLSEVRSSSDMLQVRTTSPDADVMARTKATAGHGLELTVRPGLKIGRHEFTIDLWPDAAGNDSPAHPKVTLPVVCEVVGNFSIYGRRVDGTTLRFGAVQRGRETREQVSLFVRGEQHDLEFLKIEAEPGFLKVVVQRDKNLQGNVARYLLDVAVPSDAPVANHMGPLAGKVRLRTNHATMPEVSFAVELAVFE